MKNVNYINEAQLLKLIHSIKVPVKEYLEVEFTNEVENQTQRSATTDVSDFESVISSGYLTDSSPISLQLKWKDTKNRPSLHNLIKVCIDINLLNFNKAKVYIQYSSFLTSNCKINKESYLDCFYTKGSNVMTNNREEFPIKVALDNKVHSHFLPKSLLDSLDFFEQKINKDIEIWVYTNKFSNLSSEEASDIDDDLDFKEVLKDYTNKEIIDLSDDFKPKGEFDDFNDTIDLSEDIESEDSIIMDKINEFGNSFPYYLCINKSIEGTYILNKEIKRLISQHKLNNVPVDLDDLPFTPTKNSVRTHILKTEEENIEALSSLDPMFVIKIPFEFNNELHFVMKSSIEQATDSIFTKFVEHTIDFIKLYWTPFKVEYKPIHTNEVDSYVKCFTFHADNIFLFDIWISLNLENTEFKILVNYYDNKEESIDLLFTALLKKDIDYFTKEDVLNFFSPNNFAAKIKDIALSYHYIPYVKHRNVRYSILDFPLTTSYILK